MERVRMTFPEFQYSNKQVAKVGKELRGQIFMDEDNRERVIEIFKIAHSWRDSHAFPMRSIRSEVHSRMSKLGIEGVTAARLKRMPSIRDKLRKLPYNLNQIQDLGGVRAIVPSMEQLNRLRHELETNSSNLIINIDNHISQPKIDGYRSLHVIFKFQCRGDADKYTGRRIELQLRTRLQHSWATAVEAVSLYTGQNMKAGYGSSDWLRLFYLISIELALAEKSPIPGNSPTRTQRVEEIKNLNDKVNATDILEDLRQTAKALDMYDFGQQKPEYFLVEYDNIKKIANVRPKFGLIEGVKSYEKREIENNIKGLENRGTVLVEADKVEDLKAAYPNYYGDVQYFVQNLKKIVKGKEAEEYTLPPRRTPPPQEKPSDMSWMRPGRNRRWKF
jgi:ppGpp synthetase/RelA/SpoT-type nucleotidyltranferase